MLVYVYKEAPFLALLCSPRCGRDLGTREEAAAVLGALAVAAAALGDVADDPRAAVVGSIVVVAYVAGAFEVPLLVGPNLPADARRRTPSRRTEGDLIAGQGIAAAALLLIVAAFSIAARGGRGPLRARRGGRLSAAVEPRRARSRPASLVVLPLPRSSLRAFADEWRAPALLPQRLGLRGFDAAFGGEQAGAGARDLARRRRSLTTAARAR